MSKTDVDSDLLANFIHQVVNPLNAVSGTLDNIIDGTVTGERRDQRMRAAKAQLEQCVGLIRNLAYFAGTSLASPDQGGATADEQCVIPNVVIEAAQFFQEVAAIKRISIELDDKVSQYMVKGSRALLRQVFMNLFDNAVKYSASNSKVTIHPWIQSSTQKLLVSVTSVGVAIDKGEEQKIFEVGYRGRHALQKTASGSGLGLTICQKIMQTAFGGSIEVEPTKGSGETVFLLRFPSCELLPNRISPETGRRERYSKNQKPPKGRSHHR